MLSKITFPSASLAAVSLKSSLSSVVSVNSAPSRGSPLSDLFSKLRLPVKPFTDGTLKYAFCIFGSIIDSLFSIKYCNSVMPFAA